MSTSSAPSRSRETSTVSNRSLERGLDILRAFASGTTLLKNSDLAELTGLARPTVTRLTRTLVEGGFLEHDASRKAYRLGVPVLGLTHAFRTGSTVLRAAAPLMKEVAQHLRINVGIAGADRTEMVYLESVRYSARPSLRTVVSGQRVPMKLTSLGRAYLSQLSAPDLAAQMNEFRAADAVGWTRLEKEIILSLKAVKQRGYCVTSWQPLVVAIATPLVIPGHNVLALNFSLQSEESLGDVEARLAGSLLELRDQIVNETERLDV
jgi:DNA-binding IclR family transcriptional regulator